MGSFEYSNTGVGLLGYILCKVSGSTYDDLLKKYITGPLNMTETAAMLNPEQNGRFVDGHTSTGKKSLTGILVYMQGLGRSSHRFTICVYLFRPTLMMIIR